jgi:hypothetical protein
VHCIRNAEETQRKLVRVLPGEGGDARKCLSPYLDRRLTGDVVGANLVQSRLSPQHGPTILRFPVSIFKGTIAASDTCNLISSTDGTNLQYRATWMKLGGGAGALSGPFSLTTKLTKASGTMVYLRPFLPTGVAPPDIRGQYTGSFQSNTTEVTGSLFAAIQDGTSNTLTTNLRLVSGRTITDFQIAADVDCAGNFVGIGTAPDGKVVLLQGVAGSRIMATYTISTPTGVVVDTGSIIAILIG